MSKVTYRTVRAFCQSEIPQQGTHPSRTHAISQSRGSDFHQRIRSGGGWCGRRRLLWIPAVVLERCEMRKNLVEFAKKVTRRRRLVRAPLVLVSAWAHGMQRIVAVPGRRRAARCVARTACDSERRWPFRRAEGNQYLGSSASILGRSCRRQFCRAAFAGTGRYALETSSVSAFRG